MIQINQILVQIHSPPIKGYRRFCNETDELATRFKILQRNEKLHFTHATLNRIL